MGSQPFGTNRLPTRFRGVDDLFTSLSRCPRPNLRGKGASAPASWRGVWRFERMVFGFCIFLFVLAVPGLSLGLTQAKGDKPSTRETADLKIELLGGEEGIPVKNASVYVEYRQGRLLAGKKKYKYGVKTNQEGVASIREIPKGKVLIQVVAEGWKTFGKVYDIEKDEATVQIRLQRPKKWY